MPYSLKIDLISALSFSRVAKLMEDITQKAFLGNFDYCEFDDFKKTARYW